MKRKHISDVDFVTAWTKAAALEDVVAATGLGRLSAQARASKLRKAGVRLRRFGRAKKVVDVKGLNALIEKLGGGRAR